MLLQKPSVGVPEVYMPTFSIWSRRIPLRYSMHGKAVLKECVVHLVTYLELFLRNARTYDGMNMLTGGTHLRYGLGDYLADSSSPPGMDGGYSPFLVIVKQHRYTVRRLDAYAKPGDTSEYSVRILRPA